MFALNTVEHLGYFQLELGIDFTTNELAEKHKQKQSEKHKQNIFKLVLTNCPSRDICYS